MDTEDLRLAVYDAFRRTGRAPDLDRSDPTVRDGLRDLAAQRHLVLDDNDAIVMAHPFSAVPLGFSVMGKNTLWWGGCCWDSFALAHLLPEEPSVLVATTCPSCGRAGAWAVNRDAPPTGEWLAHFLVPVARMWDDVVHTCAHQRMFCTDKCVDDWCAKNDHTRGFTVDLKTLWRLAQGWYAGRFERGYVRREPAAAVEYLRGVGLVDPFWGTA
jgi:hypothetical protein